MKIILGAHGEALTVSSSPIYLYPLPLSFTYSTIVHTYLIHTYLIHTFLSSHHPLIISTTCRHAFRLLTNLALKLTELNSAIWKLTGVNLTEPAVDATLASVYCY